MLQMHITSMQDLLHAAVAFMSMQDLLHAAMLSNDIISLCVAVSQCGLLS